MQDNKLWFWTSEMAELEKLYIFDGREEGNMVTCSEYELKEWIATHRRVIPVLKKISSAIKKYFPEIKEIHLKLSFDPEGGYKELWVNPKYEWTKEGNHDEKYEKYWAEWEYLHWEEINPKDDYESHIHIASF